MAATEQQMHHQKGQAALLRGLKQGVLSTALKKNISRRLPELIPSLLSAADKL